MRQTFADFNSEESENCRCVGCRVRLVQGGGGISFQECGFYDSDPVVIQIVMPLGKGEPRLCLENPIPEHIKLCSANGSYWNHLGTCV